MNKKGSIVSEWLTKAEHDLGMAKLAIDYKPEYKDQICFHSQQAAEKYLKAYFVLRDITFKKTHSLAYLLDLLGEFETIPDKIYRAAEILEDYGVEVRYPGDWVELNEDDIKEAYQGALDIKEFVILKVNSTK